VKESTRIRVADFGTVLVTRERGRLLGDQLPGSSAVVLDFKEVRAASPSFLDQLRRAATERGSALTFENASAHIQHTLEILDAVVSQSNDE
jgi:hypothetical protein